MTLPSFRLDGRVALVTGASQGLGQSAALALAEAGADIAVIDYAEATDTVTQVEALGRRAHSIRLDLVQATADDLEAAVSEVVMTLGRIDVLVNNAGIIRRAPVLEHSAKDWDDVLAINLDAVFHLSQRVGHRFVAQGSGKIVNIASMLSFQGGVFVPGYAASKHAVAGITKSFANEPRRPRRLRERHRAGLHGDGEHRTHPRRRGPRAQHPGPHPRRAVGHPRRPCRTLRVPRLVSLGLPQRGDHPCRRRLARALSRSHRP